jgi:hypothetical protein
MQLNKAYFIIGAIIAFGLFFEIAAHADELDEATAVTFSVPVQIPGQVLPAGTYLFKLADSDSDRNIVQIFNSDGTVLDATLPTIPTERQQATGDTVLTLGEQQAGQPDALLKWFYPGRLTGNEFAYSGSEEKELAQGSQHTIVASQKTTNSDAQAGD